MKKLETKKVIRGRGRGKRLGFPTLNFPLQKEDKIKRGVWVVILKSENHLYSGVANVGRAETFGEKEESIEVHLLSQLRETIKEANIIFLKHLRKTKKFGNAKVLKKQIKKDVKKSRTLLKSLKIITSNPENSYPSD